MSEEQAAATATKSAPSDMQTQGKHDMRIKRLSTKPGVPPFDEIEWELRTTTIQNEKGQVIFEQRNVEVPRDWSQTATNIVASKYFHGKLGTAEHESSVKQLISRVADTIAQWGVEDGYFRREEDARVFHDELLHLLVRQKASFNSPVWFNCGLWHKYRRTGAGGAFYWDPATGDIKMETGPTDIRSAQPALSIPSKITSKAFSSWRKPRGCCSGMARAVARISHHSVPPPSHCRVAAWPPVPFRL